MKRTGFARKTPAHQQRDPDRVRSTPTATPGAWRAPQSVSAAPAASVHKDAPVRSEPYRRAVASLPCCICGIHGYSQAAHGSQGKGMGIKASDMELFPACGPRPGEVGCHAKIDQGALYTKDERRRLELQWATETRATIMRLGIWPKNLPSA